MKTYLKIKIKSLAEEAKIIRFEEKKFKGRPEGSVGRKIFWGLREHRVTDVRDESRAACLAYGFLRDRAYHRIEAKCYTPPNWNRVEALVLKYGSGDQRELKQRFAEWKDAKAPVEKAAIAA
jgi:hypothetical protein